MDSKSLPRHTRARSVDADNRRPIEQALTTEGIHRDMDTPEIGAPLTQRMDTAVVLPSDERAPNRRDEFRQQVMYHPTSHSGSSSRGTSHPSGSHDERRDTGKGHAHNPLEDSIILDIGVGGEEGDAEASHVLSESPSATEVDIYETAYQDEVEKIRRTTGGKTTLYLTRRVDDKNEFKEDESLIGRTQQSEPPKSGFAKLLEKAKEQGEKTKEQGDDGRGPKEE